MGIYAITNASAEEVRAFIPLALPPANLLLLLNDALQALLATANTVVGRLAVAGKLVPPRRMVHLRVRPQRSRYLVAD